jgi:hypothetical protein
LLPIVQESKRGLPVVPVYDRLQTMIYRPFSGIFMKATGCAGWNGHPWAKKRIAITISYYHKTPLHYARTVANSGESAMLINKRRFTRAL